MGSGFPRLCFVESRPRGSHSGLLVLCQTPVALGAKTLKGTRGNRTDRISDERRFPASEVIRPPWLKCHGNGQHHFPSRIAGATSNKCRQCATAFMRTTVRTFTNTLNPMQRK